MKKNKNLLIMAIVALLGFSAGRFMGPKEVEIKEVEKIVYKEREIKDERKDTRSTRREVVRPDGTREIEIVRETQKELHSDTQTEGSKETVSEKKTSNQSDWSVGIYTNQTQYLGTIDRRIIGGLFLGVYVRSDLTRNLPEAGLGLRIEF